MVPPIRNHRPIAVLTKTTTDRSLLFIILMRPVTKVAPDRTVATITATSAVTGLNRGSDGSKGSRTWHSAKNRMEAKANPVDHLPKGVFGKIAIPMLLL
jgi:hypothetical protein